MTTRTPESLQRFEEKLRSQQTLLERNMLTAVKEGRQSNSDDLQDAADLAVQSYQRELMFLQGTQGHTQLTQVRAALERLTDGSFGECQLCGEQIGEKRLEAVPWTPYCISCQEKIENGEIEDPVRAA
ncbi:TraR/DksA family transcriptional regulator [Acidipila sp. EB88]|uniref:TraR/DksA family transcriptional regulator n=1 Tax=Acidipila sp. EB88 TaxID=2305226 RepID=UPI001F2D6836|nr:TraR/DksA family transcriptional regulator [Acidipila sp. EB88]